MGKFFLTNRSDWAESLNRALQDAGFRDSGQYTCKEKSILHLYHKLCFDTENMVIQGEDFVGCCGTLIYGEKIGSAALTQILEDYSRCRDINQIRRNCIGSYMLVVKFRQTLTLCGDEGQSYYIYYYCDPSAGLMVSNNYYHVAKTTGQPVEPYLLIQTIAARTLMDNRSPFRNICRLCADEAITIDLSSGECGVSPIGINAYFAQNEEMTLPRIAQIMLSYVKRRAKVLPVSGLAMSGGTDSRMLLSVNLKAQEDGLGRTIMINWKSDDESMVGLAADTDIVKRIGKQLNIPMVIDDLTDTELVEELRQARNQEWMRYGELLAFHNGNRKYHAFLNREDFPAFIEYGNSGEIARADETETLYSPDLQDVVSYFINRTSSKITRHVLDQKQYREMYAAQFDWLLNKFKISKNMKLTKKTCGLIFDHFITMENLDHVNITNLFRYSTSLMTQREIFDAWQLIDHDVKLHGHGTFSVVRKLYPALLDIPVCSHKKLFGVDRRTLNMHLLEKDQKSVKDWLKQIPVVGSIMKRLGVIVYGYIPYDKRAADRSIRKQIIPACRKQKHFKDMRTKLKLNSFSEIPYVTSFYLNLKMLENLEARD